MARRRVAKDYHNNRTLGWEQGFYGKAIVYKDDTYHIWGVGKDTDGSPIHTDVEDREVRSYLVIGKDGLVRNLSGNPDMAYTDASDDDIIRDTKIIARAINGTADDVCDYFDFG